MSNYINEIGESVRSINQVIISSFLHTGNSGSKETEEINKNDKEDDFLSGEDVIFIPKY